MCKGERDWRIGEVIFIKIIEFNFGFKRWLTCVWRKGRGGDYLFNFLFSKCIWSFYYVLDIVFGIGYIKESKVFVVMEFIF